MAEAEVTLVYKSLPVKVSCLALTITLPVFALFCVWSWIGITMAVGSGAIQAGPTTVLIFAQIVLLAAIAFGAFVLSDRTIFVNRQGISFPIWLGPAMSLRSHHTWSNVQNVTYSDKRLVMYFDDGMPAKLHMSKLTGAEAQQLLVALDVWSGGAAKFPDLEIAKAEMHLLTASSDKNGYTEMWEEELTRRFGATNFIPLEPEQQVLNGKYVVERQLAFGGFSAIYLVRDERKRQFVLKEAVIPEDAEEALRAEAVRLFDREAQMLAQLNHPQIAKVHDNFIDRGRHYMVLQYIQGQDLRKYVRQHGVPSEEIVVTWGRQIAEIIAHLHSRNVPIIHRDISPDNIIADDSGVIHLIDFGASNLFLGTATGTMIGKQAYMSAEQLRGKATVKSDIYGLGCTLNYLLTGRDPEPLTESRPSLQNSKVSKKLDDLVCHCTALEPQDRPESAQQVATELSQLERIPV